MSSKIKTHRSGRARRKFKKAAKMHGLTMGKHRGGRKRY